MQAYGGVQGGKEEVNGARATHAGLYFPVGFEITPANQRWGVFVQVIDVGAIASSRLSAASDSVANGPEVGFGQVVAPGAYLTVAIRNTPLSWGLGGSFVPKLRRSTADGEEDIRFNAFRLGFFIAVDIGIFP